MSETDVEQGGPNKALIIAGVSMIVLAAGLYLLSKRAPCGCGEQDVEEIARASAQLAEDARASE